MGQGPRSGRVTDVARVQRTLAGAGDIVGVVRAVLWGLWVGGRTHLDRAWD